MAILQDAAGREREELFCFYCARGYDPEAAAGKAGWPAAERPRRAAALLAKPRVLRRIRQMGDQLHRAGALELARRGLERLALEATEPVRLDAGDEGAVPGGLFHVAEVRRPKGGGVEVRYFDRLKALELLAGLQDNREAAGELLEALNRSAGALGEVGDGEV